METQDSITRLQHPDRICPVDFMKLWNYEVYEAVAFKPSDEDLILENIANAMSIPDETVQELAEVCGTNTLYTGNEPKHKYNLLNMTEVPSGVELECVSFQMKQRKLRQENDGVKLTLQRKMKYSNLDECMGKSGTNRLPVAHEFQVSKPEVILTVQVTKCLIIGTSSCRVRERETYLVLGSQHLTELRDKIKCSSDCVIPGDYSSMPDVDPKLLQKAGDIFKSSCLFIENTFYNDTRLPDNKDYSKPIIKWAEEHLPGEVMSTANMQDTTFCHLKIRLGQNYLFLHQGNCEHAVVFTDLRLFSADDNQDRRAYPLLSITRTHQRAVCQSCCKLSAKWVVRESPLIPTDPTFLCRICFKTLMYTKDGRKISNFKAFHFSDTFV
ncbi:unnamed protein product [Lymnaea stagnalis]|uniref:snRNA-activating protein complex subunit 3 n=1 Tax=Lymnaea stagnalis TaxID=6523 RepID=A0AAV2HC72_LYMST